MLADQQADSRRLPLGDVVGPGKLAAVEQLHQHAEAGLAQHAAAQAGLGKVRRSILPVSFQRFIEHARTMSLGTVLAKSNVGEPSRNVSTCLSRWVKLERKSSDQSWALVRSAEAESNFSEPRGACRPAGPVRRCWRRQRRFRPGQEIRRQAAAAVEYGLGVEVRRRRISQQRQELRPQIGGSLLPGQVGGQLGAKGVVATGRQQRDRLVAQRGRGDLAAAGRTQLLGRDQHAEQKSSFSGGGCWESPEGGKRLA